MVVVFGGAASPPWFSEGAKIAESFKFPGFDHPRKFQLDSSDREDRQNRQVTNETRRPVEKGWLGLELELRGLVMDSFLKTIFLAPLLVASCAPQPSAEVASSSVQAGVESYAPGEKLNTEPVSFVAGLIQRNKGVFLGDIHGENEIPKFILSSLPQLKAAGLKCFFIEMFKSEDQGVLDDFKSNGQQSIIIDYLDKNKWWKGEGWTQAIAELLQGLRLQNVSLIALDIEHSGDSRLETSNPHWVSIVVNNPNCSKYVLWGGKGHSANYPSNKGVDALLQIPSIDFSPTTEEKYDYQTFSSKQFSYSPGVYAGDKRSSDYVIRLANMAKGLL